MVTHQGFIAVSKDTATFIDSSLGSGSERVTISLPESNLESINEL